MTSHSRIAMGAAAVCAIAAATAVTVQQVSAPDGTDAAGAPRADDRAAQEKIIIAHGADHLPNQTASDWVTYSDHVVAATAVAQREVAPKRSELRRGEGLIGRQVTLRVDDVLWSREGAPKKAPATWRRSSVGWQFTEGDTANRVKVAKADSPRVEVGHSYVIAIVWEQDPCTGKGRWRGLGEGSTVPFDGGVVGAGEMEGRVRSAPGIGAKENGPAGSLEAQQAGRKAPSLVKALESAPQEARTFAQPGEVACE